MKKLFILTSTVLLFVACSDQLTSSEYLFEKYFEVYPIQISAETNRIEPLLAPAYKAYGDEDFATVLKITSDYTRNVAELPIVMMAQSMGYIFADSLGKADRTLAILEAHPVVGDDASWYRALIKVKEDDFNSARQLLATVARNGDSGLTAKAAALNAEIEPN